MLVDVVEARATSGTRIFVRFEDDVQGEVDLSHLVPLKGVFAPLRDPAEVARVMVHHELGTVYWPGGADLDPDVLYAALTGKKIELETVAHV